MKDCSGWIIIINPKSCGGRGLKHWPRLSNLLNYRNVEFTCVFTERRLHAIELAVSAINKGYRKIAVFAGFGTFHEVLNSVYIQKTVSASDLSLAMIPILYTRDINPLVLRYKALIKNLHQDFSTYSQVVEAMLMGKTKEYRVAKFDYYETKVLHHARMALIAGIGFESNVCLLFKNLQDSGRGGKKRSFLSVLMAFVFYNSSNYLIKVDGKEVFNSKLFSGTLEMTEDDSLRIKIFKRFKFGTRIAYFLGFYSGKIYKSQKMISYQGSSIDIISTQSAFVSNRVDVEIDGETLGEAPVSVGLEEEMVRLLIG